MLILYYGAILLLVVVVLWAMKVHHEDRAQLEAWTSDWNHADAFCVWRAGSTATELCLERRGAAVHLTPDDVRDPRRQQQQTTGNHVFVEGRLMRRFAGIDPYLVVLSDAVEPSSVKHAERGIELTDTLLAFLAAGKDRIVEAMRRQSRGRRERNGRLREWQEHVGLRRIEDDEEGEGQ